MAKVKSKQIKSALKKLVVESINQTNDYTEIWVSVANDLTCISLRHLKDLAKVCDTDDIEIFPGSHIDGVGDGGDLYILVNHE